MDKPVHGLFSRLFPALPRLAGRRLPRLEIGEDVLPELLDQRGERLVDLPGEVVGAGAGRIVEVEQLHPFGKRPPALGGQEADPLARCDKLGDHFGAVAGIDDVRLEARLEAEAVGLLGPARGRL